MNATACQHLRRRDRALAAIIRRAEPCALAPQPGVQPWQALVRSVVYQQLNGTAAAAIFQRFLALFPNGKLPKPEVIVALPEASLRRAGLSRAKTLAIKDVAAQTVAGVVPNRRQIARLSDAEIIARLTTIRGVGPWTVEMLLMFTLGRPDVLPATDYGVRSGFALVYGGKELPTPKELLAFGERWRPYRSVAAWYLWRAVDLAREHRLPKI
ncbi:MAG: DNA-3-methyladenine glycosylase [Verrucomicrobiae bacterium]|nr:DNA-3-methyladenine glycosylase [Verrucomicrobiae bacterium]